MRRSLIAVALCIGASLSAPTAHPQGNLVSETVPEQLIERAERTWAEALVSKDLQQLTGVLDNRFSLVTLGHSESLGLQAYLQQQGDTDRTYEAVTPNSIDISVHGNTAVAVVSMTINWPKSHKHRHRHWQFTDTWVRDSGEWRALVRVSEPLPTS